MNRKFVVILMAVSLPLSHASAGESLLGRIKSAETLPKGALEVEQSLRYRKDKGAGDYEAWDSKTEIEYGVTDRFTAGAELKMLAIDTDNLMIDGYLPGPEDYNFRPSGVEASMQYNFLSPARDDFGLSGYVSVSHSWLDQHSGQDKSTTSLELELLAQKYFMEGQLIWMGNTGLETTYAKRDEIDGLPVGFDWPTDPEMEIGFMIGTGLSYRIANNWFLGAEVIYETELETEVGQERYSWFAGPSIHYANADWWTTFSWLPQISGGGEQFDQQDDKDLHLIEKTEQEFIWKVGLNF